VDVNAQGGEYGTVLQAASNRDHEKLVELLLSKGADVISTSTAAKAATISPTAPISRVREWSEATFN